MEYQTREFSISLAHNFCIELLNHLQKAKDIIDQGYDMVIRPRGEDQVEISQEEANRRRADYENASWLNRMFRKSAYLEAMQRLLFSQRLVNMKRYYTAVLEDFMAITRGWKETLENSLTLIGIDPLMLRKNNPGRSTSGYISIGIATMLKNQIVE